MKLSEEIRRELLYEYNKDPAGWRVYVGRDVKGHTDIIFIHGQDVWFLKEEVVSPFETVGFGTRSVMPSNVTTSLPTFGFRPISTKMVEKLLKAIHRQDDVRDIIIKLLNQKPRSLSNIRTEALLEGPVVGSQRTLELFPEQKELDLKLRRELEKLLEKRYPHLLTTYR